MFRRFLVVAALAAGPCVAQPVPVPDCTVDVDMSEGPKLEVVYRCRSSTPISFQADGAHVAAHVRDLVLSEGEARYRFDLAAFAREANSTSTAVLRGGGVLAVLSSWLLEPRGYDRAPIIDIRVRAADGLVFSSGLPKVGDAWRLAGANVRFAGYSVLGRLTLQDIAVPAPGSLRPGAAKEEGVLRLAILDGVSESGRADVVDWVKRTAEAQSNYWQGFTAKQMLVGLVPSSNRRAVGFGRTVSGGGATVMVEIGSDVDRRRLFNDWVLVHELIHTGMPYVRGRATWFMEGAATYIEPIIRARAGWKTEAEAWMEWVDNMPQGSGAFGLGLANGSGRENYWSGATFMLMADVAIRRATEGARGLEDCLKGVLWSGLDAPRRVTLQDYALACDKATGTTVMSELVERHQSNARPVDLAAMWRELGISVVAGRVVLDDSAPLAPWRKTIVFGPAGQGARTVKLPWDS